MSRLVKILISLVVVIALAVGGFFVFEYFDHRGKVKDSERSCGSLTTPASGAALPSGLPFTLPDGQTLLSVDTQGKTVIVTVSLKGGRDQLVDIRDQAVKDLKAQGYTASATDAEPTFEAEGKFGGKVDGTINAHPLCEGFDSIRYKFNR